MRQPAGHCLQLPEQRVHLRLAPQMRLWAPMDWAEGLCWELRMLSWWEAAQQTWLFRKQEHPCPCSQTGMQRGWRPDLQSALSPEQRS